tara:strand:- start:1392 stop:2393 length:1002 start_codon:yes stop_codon:yes gene_type:complete
MIVKYFDLKKTNFQKKKFFLLYGNNKGLIEETINKDLKPNFSKNIKTYDENEVIESVDVFKEEILNKSFFEEDKLIIINRISDKILETIEEIRNRNVEDIKIILKSGILEKKSKIRKFFEKEHDLVVVPFYEDNNQTLFIIAKKFFDEKKIKISSENINLIVERSRGDRINIKNELEKIFNFARNKKNIDYQDILKLTNLAENHGISELVDQCLSKNKKKTLNIINENNSSPEDNILIIKTFLYKLKRLKKLKSEIDKNEKIDAAITSYKPPIFWKDKEIVKQQLKNYSYREINELIQNVNDLEVLVKKNSQISNQITYNFILERLDSPNNKT